MEKLLRDAKLLQTYQATSQVQRVVIARSLLKESRRSGTTRRSIQLGR